MEILLTLDCIKPFRVHIRFRSMFVWHKVWYFPDYQIFQNDNAFRQCISKSCIRAPRSGGGVVDNTLDYQSRGRKIDPPLLRSFG